MSLVSESWTLARPCHSLPGVEPAPGIRPARLVVVIGRTSGRRAGREPRGMNSAVDMCRQPGCQGHYWTTVPVPVLVIPRVSLSDSGRGHVALPWTPSGRAKFIPPTGPCRAQPAAPRRNVTPVAPAPRGTDARPIPDDSPVECGGGAEVRTDARTTFVALAVPAALETMSRRTREEAPGSNASGGCDAACARFRSVHGGPAAAAESGEHTRLVEPGEASPG